MNSSDKRCTPLDAELARLAARQHGIVQVRQLYALGMGRDDVSYRVRIGRLHRIHRGVYAVGHVDLGERAYFIAAVVAIGHGAALSHEAAGAHFAFGPFRGGPIDVTVARRARHRAGIRVHAVQTLDAADVTWRHGIRVTTPARTLLDISRTLPRTRATRMVNEALVQRKVTVPLLYRRAEGPRGAALRSLLADASPTRSELEDVTLAFLVRHGMRPETNARVAGWEVDFFLPGQRLVIEADGARFHDNLLQRAADERKQAALEAAGLRVVRLGWKDVTGREAETARRICAAPTSRAA